jgi:hypothetical protein
VRYMFDKPLIATPGTLGMQGLFFSKNFCVIDEFDEI